MPDDTSSIVRTAHGFFCAACGECMTQEEIDFDSCACCGGNGFEDDPDDDWIYGPDET
jgi:hypothetical protein